MNITTAASSLVFGLMLLMVASTASVTSSAQGAAPQSSDTSPAIPGGTADPLSQEELEDLLGPIALYPDALLANVLAASVFPDDVVAAHEIVSRGGDPSSEGDPDWDPSIGMISSFPEVLSMMAEYLDWTAAIGSAYLFQAGDVMSAIQSLRTVAWENGALRTSEQQVVVQEGPTIIIEPADPQVIFVPVYSPSVVFVRNPVSPVAVGVISFGVGVTVGAIWRNNVHCNWSGRCVSWGPGWWGRTNVNVNINNNRNTNVNINRPGGGNVNVNRPGGGNTNINRPGGGNSNINRPGGRPGGDGSAWRPSPDRIPDRVARPGRPGGSDGGSRIPTRRPGDGGSIGGGGGLGGVGGGSGISRPESRPGPARPPVSRPPTNRPGESGISRPGSGGATARPSPPQVRPSDRPRNPSAGPSVSGPSRPTARPAPRPSSRPSPALSRPGGAPAARPAPSRPSGFQPGTARPSGGGSVGGGGGGRIGGARGR